MDLNLANLKHLALGRKKAFNKLINQLKRMRKKEVDELFHKEHDRAFEQIDCLQCANCCSTTSPIFLDTDLRRIADHLNLPTGEFMERYIHMDEDGDFVLNEAPCAFLGEDNYCSIYEVRPVACQEYPHTNRKNMQGILELSRKNTEICPAVFEVFKQLEREL